MVALRSEATALLSDCQNRVVGGVRGGTGAEFTKRLCFPNVLLRVVGGV